MGLDMYLKKHLCIWDKDQDKIKVQGYENEKAEEVVFEGMYWRKANAIHKWFVDNVQEGEDNCKDYYVDRDDLKKLLDICKQIKENPEQAEELLPCESGFFFGSQDYDEWYYKNIEDTIEGIEKLLKDSKDFDFYYSSSW